MRTSVDMRGPNVIHGESGSGTAPTLVTRYVVTYAPGLIAGLLTVQTTVSVPGLQTTDMVIAIPRSTLTLGIVMASVRCSAPDTLMITFGNVTALGINLSGSVTFDVLSIT